MKTTIRKAGLVARNSVRRRLFNAVNEVRCIAELASFAVLPHKRLLQDIPRGDGRPVLVIPGFLCGDTATLALRRFLKEIGYVPLAWKQGINWGPKAGTRVRLLHRLNQACAAFEQPVTIVGWSLGGYYARELACIRPDLVREVITLGSPIQGNPDSIAVWHAFRWINRRNMPQLKWGPLDFPQPSAVPCLSIFTKRDGIVPWQFCVPARGCGGDTLQVRGSHIGLIANPEVMRILGSHLGAPRALGELARSQRTHKRREARAKAGLAAASAFTTMRG